MARPQLRRPHYKAMIVAPQPDGAEQEDGRARHSGPRGGSRGRFGVEHPEHAVGRDRRHIDGVPVPDESDALRRLVRLLARQAARDKIKPPTGGAA